jgi:hypothetical protein
MFILIDSYSSFSILRTVNLSTVVACAPPDHSSQIYSGCIFMREIPFSSDGVNTAKCELTHHAAAWAFAGNTGTLFARCSFATICSCVGWTIVCGERYSPRAILEFANVYNNTALSKWGVVYSPYDGLVVEHCIFVRNLRDIWIADPSLGHVIFSITDCIFDGPLPNSTLYSGSGNVAGTVANSLALPHFTTQRCSPSRTRSKTPSPTPSVTYSPTPSATLSVTSTPRPSPSLSPSSSVSGSPSALFSLSEIVNNSPTLAWTRPLPRTLSLQETPSLLALSAEYEETIAIDETRDANQSSLVDPTL